MMIRFHSANSDLGQIGINPATPAGAGGTIECAWLPNTHLVSRFPNQFCVPFRVESSPSGRRVLPLGNPDVFILQAALGGEVILQQRGLIDAEAQFSYRLMRLLFQLSGRLQERLQGRVFRRLVDLFIPTRGRNGEAADVDILPRDFGVYGPRQRRWSPETLFQEGRRTAVAAGYSRPDVETCIRFGVREEARQHPIDIEQLSDDEARGLVRMSLFDIRTESAEPEIRLVNCVVERFIDSLERHINDSTDEFNNWFFQKLDVIIRQIEKRKRGGGAIPRNVVRQAILQQVFQSYRYIADGIDAQMREIERCIRPRLTTAEADIYSAMFKRQTWLGGLPLLLIATQFPALRELVEDVLNAPVDAQAKGALLRAMYTYSEMIGRKRESERLLKQRSHARNRQAAAAILLDVDQVDQRDAVSENSEPDEFQIIAAEFRESARRKCNCRISPMWIAELRSGSEVRTFVRWVDNCLKCHTSIPIRVSLLDFRKIGLRIRNNRG